MAYKQVYRSYKDGCEERDALLSPKRPAGPFKGP